MTFETMDQELAKLSPAELELEIGRREQVKKDCVEVAQWAPTDEIADDHKNGGHIRGIDRPVCFAPSELDVPECPGAAHARYPYSYTSDTHDQSSPRRPRHRVRTPGGSQRVEVWNAEYQCTYSTTIARIAGPLRAGGTLPVVYQMGE
jgi:hypothetical protein